MYIFKLLMQIQICLSIGNLYLADKVTHIVNKFIQKKIALRNTSPYTVKLDVTIILSTLKLRCQLESAV